MLRTFAAVEQKAQSFQRFSRGDHESYLAAVVELELLVAFARKVAEEMASPGSSIVEVSRHE
jgi:hypothetical protein